MPIDTRDKRASVLGVDTSAPRLEQNPSGTIAQSGRQIAALLYSGILAQTPQFSQAALGANTTLMVFPLVPILR